MHSNFVIAQKQPQSPLISSFAAHSKLKNETIYGLEWIAVGPTLNGARVDAVQADPTNPGTIYAAFGSGGLWKTVNNGLTWKSIFENKPSLGIGDIALAPSNSDIIYVGTGESLKKPRNFTMPGTGIYKSTDGGENWKHLGLNDTWHIGEISIHPDNPDIVLVAALGHFWSSNKHRGIFRTENGGDSWTQVLYTDDNTGANDVVFSPANPNIAYATMWENYPDVKGKNSGIYKSTDGGKTWVKTIAGINIDEYTGRIGIAASYQDENKAYAFIDQRNPERSEGSGEIYKTDNGGKLWERTHENGLPFLSVVGWYFMDIYLNPENDEELFALGVRLAHSLDGGKNFDFLGGKVFHQTPSPAQTLHLDHCELWINPINPKELVLANDGGVYHSYDKGESWMHLNNIPTGEFYDITLDKSDPYNIYGGVQDDATVYGPAFEYNPDFDDKWKYLWIDAWSGGDGCITLIDPEDKNTVYFSMQNGAARRKDILADTSISIRPDFQKDSIEIDYNFITPYMLSPHNSKRMYMAGNYVMKSENRGDDWKIISPDLILQSNKEEKGTAAGAISESTLEEGVIYLGTDRGAFWVTKDGGANWEEHSEELPDNYIRSIYVSRHNKGRVYIQLTGINYDDLGAYVFVSEDYGRNWKSIKSNLPDQIVNVIYEDPDFENVLYAGTYRGLYVSENRGESWSYFGKNMPDASIADIELDSATKDLVIATHGRGIYVANLKPFYRKLKSGDSGNYLFEVPIAKRPLFRDTHGDADKRSETKIPFTFLLAQDEQVKLFISDGKDSIVWALNIDGTRGYNQYRWDLVTRAETSDQPYFVHYEKYIPQGIYKLRLETSEGIMERELIVENYK